LNFGKPFYPLKNLLNALSRCPIEAINDWLLTSFNHSFSVLSLTISPDEHNPIEFLYFYSEAYNFLLKSNAQL
jgi:hypothetical protein